MKIVLITNTGRRNPADLFVAGFFEKGKPSREFSQLEPAFTKSIQPAVKSGRFEGKFSQTLSSFGPSNREAGEVILLGLGESKNHRPLCCRKAMAQIVKLAKSRKAGRVRVLLDSFVGGKVDAEKAAEALAEMSVLASYDFDKYKSKKGDDAKSKKLETVEALLSQKKLETKSRNAIERSRIVAEGTAFARDLINEPANIMNADEMVRTAQDLARRKKIKCQVLREAELKRLKMGGILAVNRGSVTQPALIVLEYGEQFKKKGTVCLIGKGVTFDTGGISIKPSKDMEKMKYDMAGSAAVIAALGIAADLKLPVHVVGMTPMVENNVAKDPQRPGDIIRMYNGKTVEVLNTDAEGRLILADALSYAEKFSPKAIIDIATLTGMCAYTFGDKAIGLLGSDEKLLDKVKKAGEESGERCWELPLWEDYAQQIKGHHSDLYNIGGPYAGTITAAMFLKEFVPEKTAWAHLDIAGTGWCDSPRYDCGKGATGVGVRLFTRLLLDWK